MSTQRIKTAVIGVGSLGKHHLKWLSQLPQSELVGCYDTDGEKAKAFAEQYKVVVFDSLEDCAAAVEAVSIVVPTQAHFAVAKFCIEQGKHCLIEKPVTPTVEQAKELEELASKHNVKVGVGHIERYNPAVRAALETGIRPSFIEAHRLAAFDPRGTDVAVILDLMIHDIDLALLFMQQPVAEIRASAVAVVSESADIANARLTFANGAVANLTASRISLHEMRKIRLFQQAGYVSLDLAKKEADLYSLVSPDEKAEGMRLPLGKSGRDVLYRKKQNDGVDMLGNELGQFLDAILDNSPVPISIADGREALRIALEVDRIGRDAAARLLSGQGK